MTSRGRAVVLATALTVGFGAGLSAQLWNPYTRHLDRVQNRRTTNVPTLCAIRPAHPLKGVAYLNPGSPRCAP